MTINMEEVNEFLSGCSEKTAIYVGCDSQVFYDKSGTRMAKYTTAIVIHIDGCRGGKLFYETSTERDFSPNKKKPSIRLMNEVYKVSDVYLRLTNEAENCLDKDIEVHLDISPKKENKSSEVVREALGYIQGTCQVEPILKPDAFAASAVADNF